MEIFSNNNKEKNLILNNKLIQNNNKLYKNTNKNKINIYYDYISYHRNNSKNKSITKKGVNFNVKKEDLKQFSKKLFYIKKNGKIISHYYSHNNSSNKKESFMKIMNNTRNLELSDIVKKNNYSITFNKNINNESKSKSKHKKKIIKNECITEPSKENSTKKYFCQTQRKTNIIAKDFIKQIKSAQKKATNKLIKKLNYMNNKNNININLLEKKMDNKINIEKIKK